MQSTRPAAAVLIRSMFRPLTSNPVRMMSNGIKKREQALEGQWAERENRKKMREMVESVKREHKERERKSKEKVIPTCQT